MQSSCVFHLKLFAYVVLIELL